MKILFASSIDPDAITALEQRHDVIRAFNADTAHLRAAAAEREVIVFRRGVQLSEHVLDGAPNLQLLVRAGSDLDNVDLGANPRDPAHQAQGRRRRPAHRIDRPHLRARPNEGGHCAGRVRRTSPPTCRRNSPPISPTALFPTDQRRSHRKFRIRQSRSSEHSTMSNSTPAEIRTRHPKDGNTRCCATCCGYWGIQATKVVRYQGGGATKVRVEDCGRDQHDFD